MGDLAEHAGMRADTASAADPTWRVCCGPWPDAHSHTLTLPRRQAHAHGIAWHGLYMYAAVEARKEREGERQRV